MDDQLEHAGGLDGFTDSDWGNSASRKSTTGLVARYKRTPIPWRSRMQKTVALSSAEAEYYSASEMFSEAGAVRAQCENGDQEISKPEKLLPEPEIYLLHVSKLIYEGRLCMRYHFRRTVTCGPAAGQQWLPGHCGAGNPWHAMPMSVSKFIMIRLSNLNFKLAIVVLSPLAV